MTQKHFSAKVILSIIAALLIICTLSTVTLAANQVANYGCAYGQAVPTNDKLSAKVSQYNFYGDEGTLYFMQISKGKADAHYAVEIFSDKSLSPNTKIRSFTKEISHGIVILRIKSAAKTKEPLSTAIKSGFLSAKSLLIFSATAFTRCCISSSGINVLNVLSLIVTVLIVCRILDNLGQSYSKMTE